MLSRVVDVPHGLLMSQLEMHESIEKVGGLVSECMRGPIKGCEFFPRNPKPEISKFTNLLMDHMLIGKRLKVVIPVCPDYGSSGEGYMLRNGMSETSKKALNIIPRMNDLFGKYGVYPEYRIDLADVEADDPTILSASGETRESHKMKTRETLEKIKDEILILGLSDVSAGLMSDAFFQRNMSYQNEQELVAAELRSKPNKRIQRVINQLLLERLRLGDYKELDERQQVDITIMELAGYSAYGKAIGGEAVILSPDAMSAIPAYHFGIKKKAQFSPIIYLKHL